ncbi:hypothetical protein FACS189499_05170 [Clostridia bacterium]|nr:hypothetical protein FACS189499_05170 [Clostridia bacterium]
MKKKFIMKTGTKILLTILLILCALITIIYILFVIGFTVSNGFFYNNKIGSKNYEYLADEFEFKFDEEKQDIIKVIDSDNKYRVALSIHSNSDSLEDIGDNIIELCKITDEETRLILTDDFEKNIESIKSFNESYAFTNLNDCMRRGTHIYIGNTAYGHGGTVREVGFFNGTYYVIFRKGKIDMNDENRFKQILKGGRYYLGR